MVKNVADIYSSTKDESARRSSAWARSRPQNILDEIENFEEAAAGARDLWAGHSLCRRAHGAISR